MPTPQEIRDSIDARLAVVLPQIVAAQEAYLSSKGRFAQVLDTHSEPPEDGEDVPPDRLNAKPHYQAETARKLAGPLLRSAQKSSLKIDQYCDPEGQRGWVLTVSCRIDGDLWSRSINHGPETWRTRGWEKMPESEV